MSNVGWAAVQRNIWQCVLCRRHPRVECNTRQLTDRPCHPTRLLIVSLAPPFAPGRASQEPARSVTNDSADHLRLFLEATLGPWSVLTAAGLTALHAVKCAIVPDDSGFQNPPRDVVDACAPLHLGAELSLIEPVAAVTLGAQAYRAIVVALASSAPPLLLTRPPNEAVTRRGFDVPGRFTLFAAPFIRGAGRWTAAELIRAAARKAGVLQ